ncbi:MAG: hypothetical protein AB8H79_12290 [Myxococcota bacterium]
MGKARKAAATAPSPSCGPRAGAALQGQTGCNSAFAERMPNQSFPEPGILDRARAELGGSKSRRPLRVDFARKVEELLLGEAVSTNGVLSDEGLDAVVAWQVDQGLPADGRVLGETRRGLESLMDPYETQLLGDELHERVLVPAEANGASRFDFYRAVVEEAGGYFDDSFGQVNLVGIRGIHMTGDKGARHIAQSASAAREVGLDQASGEPHFHGAGFDDVIVSLWVDEQGTHHVEERRGTLDPDLFWSKDKDNKRKKTEGTAHIRDGQYVYKLGRHRTSHHADALDERVNDPEVSAEDKDALDVKRAGKDRRSYQALQPESLEVLREGPKELDDHRISSEEFESSLHDIRSGNSRNVDPSGISTNVHASPEHAPSSLGCPNIPLGGGYAEFIREIEDSRDATGSNRVLFTVIDASKIGTVAAVESRPM